MNYKWIIFAFVSLSLSLTSYGLPETEDGITPNSTATKQWRVFQIKTTASSVSKTGTTTTRKMTTTTKRPPTGTTKRSGQLIAGSSTKTPTTIKRSGQQALGSAGRTSTTTKRSSTLKNSSGPNGKSSTTTAKSVQVSQPRTLPPVTAPSGYKTSMTTTKARGVPEKIKQGTTTRRVSTTTARNAVPATYPILLRSRPPVAALMSSNNFFYGMPMFSPFGMYPSNTEASSNSTTDSSNMTTTMDPVSSTTTVTALTTTPTLNNTITSNDTVEYEEHEEVLPTPAEYDYLNESDTTTPAVSVPVTETTHNVTSSIGPNMIRKRRKKVISTTTPSPNPGVVRIRLRRKKTTIAPVSDVTTVD
uniref:Uncharacterized protein n=1 Tax=Anopheles funestus TaxID=62324 RepID=A0A182R447_ANOFN